MAPLDAPPHSYLTISVLGPVRARRADRAIVLGGKRQRGVLARLAVAAGHVVPTDRVIDDLWAGEPPASAANTLQSYVSNLRKALGGWPGCANACGAARTSIAKSARRIVECLLR